MSASIVLAVVALGKAKPFVAEYGVIGQSDRPVRAESKPAADVVRRRLQSVFR
jgi:hypothetical protein